MVCAVCALSQVAGFPSAASARSRNRVFSSGSVVHGLLSASAGSSASHPRSTPALEPVQPDPVPGERGVENAQDHIAATRLLTPLDQA